MRDNKWLDTPHEYVPTKPYAGCRLCGYGRGKATHNSYEVRRYEARELEKFVGSGAWMKEVLDNGADYGQC